MMWLATTGVMAANSPSAPAGDNLLARKVGESFKLGGAELVLKVVAVLPVVKNEFNEPYHWSAFGDENLQQLRQQEKLDDVVAAGKSEFEKQVLLLEWTFKRFKLFGPPGPNSPLDALGILKAIDAGKSLNCSYFATVLNAALSSMGYVVRPIGLKGARSDGNGTGHVVVEVWSNQYRKWILLDPTLNLYFTRDGTPLHAFEVRQEWFYNQGKALTIVIGHGGQTHAVSDMPIKRGTHPGFGTLTVNSNSLGKFLYVSYHAVGGYSGALPMDMFIVKDQLAEGVPYHFYDNPKDPATEAYWPMHQAELKLTAGAGQAVAVKAGTWTPDFDKFRSRVDGGSWTDGAPVEWKLHRDENTLEIFSLNKFGVEGAVSKVVFEMR